MSRFDSCPPCKGCAAKDGEIATLRGKWNREIVNLDTLSKTFTLSRADRFKAKRNADMRRWALKELEGALRDLPAPGADNG
jgi:hypothetical protein